MKSVLSLENLHHLAGESVFDSGPHSSDGIDFHSADSFGHYNPLFLKQVLQMLDTIFENKGTKEVVKAVYNGTSLGETARSYYHAYQFVTGNPELFQPEYFTFPDGYDPPSVLKLGDVVNIYQDMMSYAANGEDLQPGDFIQEVFRPYADAAEGDGLVSV